MQMNYKEKKRSMFFGLPWTFTSYTVTEEIITVDTCLLYTSDAADEEDSEDLGGRRIIKKKNHTRSDVLTNNKRRKQE